MTDTNFDAIRDLQELCYTTAKDKGFHDDRPTEAAALVYYQGNKMMMMVRELSEGHEELRKGHGVTETYYPTQEEVVIGELISDDEVVLYKPEGVPSELADTVIRILDFCGAEGIDIAGMMQEKLAYNASREYLHGKKF